MVEILATILVVWGIYCMVVDAPEKIQKTRELWRWIRARFRR